MLNRRRDIGLAWALSALAGYADGIGFIHLGGLFVSFMSGNSTRAGVSFAEGHPLAALEALGLIALFVLGAACGSLIMLRSHRLARTHLLIVEAAILAAAGVAAALNIAHLPIWLIVTGMGMVNAIFQRQGGSGLGLTYVTGALVRSGQLLAIALNGGDRWAWAPPFLLWLSLVIGSGIGAYAYLHLGLGAVWFAAAAAAVLSVVTATLAPHE